MCCVIFLSGNPETEAHILGSSHSRTHKYVLGYNFRSSSNLMNWIEWGAWSLLLSLPPLALSLCLHGLFKFKQLNWPIHEHKRHPSRKTAFVFISSAVPVSQSVCLPFAVCCCGASQCCCCCCCCYCWFYIFKLVRFARVPLEEELLLLQRLLRYFSTTADWPNRAATNRQRVELCDWVTVPLSGLIQQSYQVACEVLILKSVTLECAAQVTDQVGDGELDSPRLDSTRLRAELSRAATQGTALGLG